MTRDARLPPGAWVLRVDTSQSWSAEVLSADVARDHATAKAQGTTVVLGGLLHNRDELLGLLGADTGDAAGDAGLVLRAYRRWGEGAIERILGPCATVVCDTARRLVLAARDRLGMYPLFHAEAGPQLLFSNSIDALLAQEGVSDAINLPVVVDHLRHVWPFAEETYFQAVRRVPPGNLLRRDDNGSRQRRYWDPEPDGRVEWVQPDEIDQFDALFEQAVARSMATGKIGVFLSGGLDSASVAAVATAHARATGEPEPLALSLAFPGDANEEPVQRAVAAALGIDQVVLDWETALGPRSLLSQMIELSAEAPAPLLNLWTPLYDRLAERGREEGCSAILTGGGGDEWLIVSPLYAADLMRWLDVRGLVRLYNENRRSHNVRALRYARQLAWTFGLRPVLRDVVVGTLRRRAPALERRRALRRLDARTPVWLAPDPALRAEMAERELRHRDTLWSLSAASNGAGRRYPRMYFAEVRTGLEHPLVSMELEQLYAQGRRAGVHKLQPFWDAQLVEFLYRTPPELLNEGGRSKALVRGAVARRFPGLGFEKQRKLAATGVVRSVVESDARRAWSEIGDARALEESGVVDAPALRRELEAVLGSRETRKYYLVWEFLALESFLRARREGKTYAET